MNNINEIREAIDLLVSVKREEIIADIIRENEPDSNEPITKEDLQQAIASVVSEIREQPPQPTFQAMTANRIEQQIPWNKVIDISLWFGIAIVGGWLLFSFF